MAKLDLNKIAQSKKNIVSTSKTSEKGSFDFLNRDIKMFGSGFSDKKKERFYS